MSRRRTILKIIGRNANMYSAMNVYENRIQIVLCVTNRQSS